MPDALHILIVDDRPDGVLFLSEFLHTRNHLVEISNDGQEALEAILRRHHTPDAYHLVFASLTMAKLDGVALLRNLARRNVEIPIALYAPAGALTPEINQQAKIHGCMAILEKPLSLQRIERLLDDIMRRRSSSVRAPVAPAAPATATQRKEDGKPFFGTSRIMRADAPPAPTAPPAPIAPPAPPAIASAYQRNPSTAELQPAAMMPPNLSLPSLPPLGGPALEPTGKRSVPPTPPPMPGIAIPPPTVPPVAAPSTAFFRSRTTDTRSTTRREGSSGYRRATEPPQRAPTGSYTRRQSGLFAPAPDPNQPPTVPTTTTARFRRTISGVQDPVAPQRPVGPLAPDAGPASHSVACAHCQQVFLVVSKPQAYTVVCVHCGQLNRIDPF